ncbi:hypothetical protein O1611_g9239 [Lasiodiplodia mahajangana]|uniref:Uncharacterized protein n=1 Tax=Lasiodiplodia mahajangana TaxID=1108764 RepID=A0ACC2JA82_9PEZI|nr:hypothetical protein O1611_g9239 [Lasiodiplodia mahajangana]
MLHNNPGTAPRLELTQADVSSSDRPPMYNTRHTSSYIQSHDYGSGVDSLSVPMAPIGGSQLLEGHIGGNMGSSQPWGTNTFSATNTGRQGPGAGSLLNFPDEARRPGSLGQLSPQLDQQSNAAEAEPSPASYAQPTKTRPKRKSKSERGRGP